MKVVGLIWVTVIVTEIIGMDTESRTANILLSKGHVVNILLEV